MWNFLARNRQVAAMLAVLTAAALVVVFLATKGSTYKIVEKHEAETEDVSESADIFSTYDLPSDDRFMASIGNGHVATNVFSDTVYMNGLYNGRNGESHRARIPAWANIRLNSTLTHHPYSPVYSLDTKKGVFTVKVDRDRSTVTQRIYAHRYYTRAIVNQIEVAPKTHVDPNFFPHEIWIAIKLLPGTDSNDVDFNPPTAEIIDGRASWKSCGKTRVSEDPEYQPLLVDVCAYWTSVPDHLVVPQHRPRVFTFVMTVDNNETIARQEYIKVLQEAEDGDNLYLKHVEEWAKLYQEANMEIKGNLKLAKIVNGIWYYFLSSLPSRRSHQPAERFFGLSPTGLARGGTLEDYEGHNFWDTEMWMFPNILLQYPDYGKQLLQYRLEMAPVAAQLAKLTGNKGYRYPWESAYTGREVTQPCCGEVARFELHVSGCVALAARRYLAASRDEHWLQHGGCAIVTNIADFWASRAVINYTTGFYDIANVMGPDEDHTNITNSIFTNVVAGYSLYLAQYVACLCKSYYTSKAPEQWADIAWSLALPYDQVLDYHPQFDGYQLGDTIKQADAVLLGFPLKYPMNSSSLANDLRYYARATRGSGPAMTWGAHAAAHLLLGDRLKAAQLLHRSYEPYLREPFKVWSELRRPDVGAVNFLTGMGGFLQALTFGYAGISLHLDKLVIAEPQLPPDATEFTITGIKYLGANLTLDIRVAGTTLSVSSLGEWPLTMFNGKYVISLIPGMSVTLNGPGPFTIRSVPWKDCHMPADTIGHNYLRPNGT